MRKHHIKHVNKHFPLGFGLSMLILSLGGHFITNRKMLAVIQRSGTRLRAVCFEHYHDKYVGATTDLQNHCQPTLT